MEQRNLYEEELCLGYRQNYMEITIPSCGGSLKTRKKILKKTSLYKGILENTKKFYHPLS